MLQSKFTNTKVQNDTKTNEITKKYQWEYKKYKKRYEMHFLFRGNWSGMLG